MRKTFTAASVAMLTCAIAAGSAVAAPRSAVRSKQASVSGMDRESLMTSMEGDLFEIRGGKQALRVSHTKAVDALATRLVKDHTKSYGDSLKLARKFGIKVETSPSPSETWELQTLAKVRGATFDRWYTSLEVLDHEQDIQETSDEIAMGTNSAVVANARQDLPMLKMHLKLSRAAYAAVK